MMMYPFFYRPQSMKLKDGWQLYPLQDYYQQIASEVGREGQRPCNERSMGGEITPEMTYKMG